MIVRSTHPSADEFEGNRMRRILLSGLVLTLSSGFLLGAEEDAGRAAALARDGENLYRQGAYSEALERFEGALAAGLETPAILYQAANCYRAARADQSKELELKKKAALLLEKEVAGGRASLPSYYYLAAIYIHNLADPVKGVAVARKGITLVEKPDPGLALPVENLYRAARLYEFLGSDEKAASMDRRFLDAAEVSPTPVDRASVRISRDKLGSHYMKLERFDEAAKVFEALLEAEPTRDRERHQWGLALLRAGRPEEASRAWRGASGDEYRTELGYLEKVAARYAATGAPASSKSHPEAAALTDQALAAKILEVSSVLREEKKKVEDAKDAALKEKIAAAKRHREEYMKLSVEERRARAQAAMRERNRAEGKSKSRGRPEPASEAETGGWKRPVHTQLPPRPPKTPEHVAAEREFFFFLAELVKRGQLIRMFCFQNGIADLVFR
jgi:tetratricopeptide (TPR) repeat protein